MNTIKNMIPKLLIYVLSNSFISYPITPEKTPSEPIEAKMIEK